MMLSPHEIYQTAYRNGRDDGYAEQGVPIEEMPDEDEAALEGGWLALAIATNA